MPTRRLLIWLLSLFACFYLATGLIGSLHRPQVVGRLELYQSNLVLEASAWQAPEWQQPLLQALDAKASTRKDLNRLITQVEQTLADQNRPLSGGDRQSQTDLLDQLRLSLGLLEASDGQVDRALELWTTVQSDTGTDTATGRLASILSGLWSTPAQLQPQAQSEISRGLRGWYRDQALDRLFSLQGLEGDRQRLGEQGQRQAESALVGLGLLSATPVVGSIVGLGVLGRWGWQRWREREQPSPPDWSVPWDGDSIAQVMLVGFVLIGQVLVNQTLFPLGISLLGVNRADLGVVGQSALILVLYGVMAAVTLGFSALSLRPYRPWPSGWFQIRPDRSALVQGLGGYLAAVPLVIGSSLISQQIWQGEGGSNPILELALAQNSNLALLLFWLTAAIAAPLFEELLFRGFLLPSLTRYVSRPAAIGLSAAFFAIAHLSLAELLPLFVLGCVLGTVYTRSRNLASSMLLHALWNSGTLASLVILGRL